MFDEGRRFGRMEGRRATRRNVNFPTLATQPARIPTGPGQMGYPQKERRGKIKACPTRQSALCCTFAVESGPGSELYPPKYAVNPLTSKALCNI
jgi:hypothetical protein